MSNLSELKGLLERLRWHTPGPWSRLNVKGKPCNQIGSTVAFNGYPPCTVHVEVPRVGVCDQCRLHRYGTNPTALANLLWGNETDNDLMTAAPTLWEYLEWAVNEIESYQAACEELARLNYDLGCQVARLKGER